MRVRGPATPGDLKALLVPYPSVRMMCCRVSKRIGYVKNNDPSLIQPV